MNRAPALKPALPWRVILLWLATCLTYPFLIANSTAHGSTIGLDGTFLDPAAWEQVSAALAKVKDAPGDIAVVETLLAVEPAIIKTIGFNVSYNSLDPVRNAAMRWAQTLQPAETLLVCLEQGSDAAVVWALRQMVWRGHNGGFDKEDVARLMPGVRGALTGAAPSVRSQAIRTMFAYSEKAFTKSLKGFLKDPSAEVVATVVEEYASHGGQTDADLDAIVTGWLKTSNDPQQLRVCCDYWWLVKSRSFSEVTEEDIASLERVAGHPDATVRSSVARAVEELAIPARPRAITILLRLTRDPDRTVSYDATRALRYANTPEVAAHLAALYASSSEEIRAAVIEVLGWLGKDQLPLILTAAATDRAPQVREWAVMSLRKIGTPEAGRGLEQATHDPDGGVQKAAQTQFGWFQREHPAKP